LPRLLRRSGIIVHPAGEQFEYHGVRAPYYFETHETVGGMVEEMREFYTAIRAGFVQSGSFEPNSTIVKSSGERLFNARPSWWTPFIRPGFAF
jgi:hypothetical protein